MGNDTYLFNIGDGQDIIIDARPASDAEMADSFAAQGIETLRFVSGIDASDLNFSLVGNDLTIAIANTADQITVKYWGDVLGALRNRDRFNVVFADGEAQSLLSLIEAYLPKLSRDGSQADDVIYGLNTTDTINGLAGNDALYGYGGNDTLNGDAGSDTLSGGLGVDTLTGGEGSDTLTGGEGDDTLYGDISSGFGSTSTYLTDKDHLTGGAGNDILKGGFGDDTYGFNLGDGQDIIIDGQLATDADMAANFTYQGLETLKLGAGINATDLVFSFDGNDLLIGIANTADQITIKYWGDVQGSLRNRDRFNVTFSDNTTQSILELVEAALTNLTRAGTSADDYIYGLDTLDVMTGLAGNDTL